MPQTRSGFLLEDALVAIPQCETCIRLIDRLTEASSRLGEAASVLSDLRTGNAAAFERQLTIVRSLRVEHVQLRDQLTDHQMAAHP